MRYNVLGLSVNATILNQRTRRCHHESITPRKKTRLSRIAVPRVETAVKERLKRLLGETKNEELIEAFNQLEDN